MEQRLAELEARVDGIAARLESIEKRLSAVDGVAVATAPAAAVTARTNADKTWQSPQPAALLTLIGRTVLVIGGAFLLRSTTDSGYVPTQVGIALGLAYAALWALLADRAGKKGARLSASFHGVAAVIAGLPLVWEATVRFHAVPPAPSAVLVLAVVGLAIAAAWRRSLPVVAWTASTGGAITAWVLFVGTGRADIFTAVLLVLGIASAWLAYVYQWESLRWVIAAMLDLAVLEMTSIAARPSGPPPGYADISIPLVQAVAVALPVVYLASIALRTLGQRRDVIPFEVVQTVAAIAIGFGGAVRVGLRAGQGSLALGAAAALVGAASYALSYFFVERHQGHGKNFVFYTSLALVLTLTGTALMLPAPVAASLWSLLAVCAALAGGLLARITLQSHAAAYVAAAAWLSGLVTVVKDAFMAGADAYWRPHSLAAGVATAAAVACCITLAIRRSSTPLPWWSRLPRLVIAALAAGGLGAALVLAIVRQLGSPDTAPGEAAVAVARSLVLAVSALLLATIGSRAALPELTWLVYPLLAVGGLKLLLEDLPHGRPATLFLAFAAFGISLIMAPRLLRGRAASGEQGAASGQTEP